MLAVLLLISTPIAATQFHEEPSQAASNQLYSEAAEFLYNYVQQEGLAVDSVCAEEHPSGVVLHVEMTDSEQTTRFSDASVITEGFYSMLNYDESVFQSVNRVSVKWPRDGEFQNRSMYIPREWVREYANQELSWEGLTATVFATETSYEFGYYPGSEAVCYPSSPTPAETEQESSNPNRKTQNQTNRASDNPSVEFLNCSTVRIHGDYQNTMVFWSTYIPGILNNQDTLGQVSGTTTISITDIMGEDYEDIDRSVIDAVELYKDSEAFMSEPEVRKENPKLEKCHKQANPDS
ncbi:hypothetical protein [Halorussus salinisoli]|uniref:hypothetical protein n=1 Tax=Halorussus salinisoli TaxID=2558242 RepID=UPI0010C1EE3B|nr:hypothetical protein [Halorussus salinisoli]